jgi:hypothetical protein
MATDDLRHLIWLALMGEVICYLAMISYFFRYLRTYHESAWMALGSPSLFLNNSLRNNWLVLKFLVTRRHRHLNDSRASRLGDATLVLLILGALGFLYLQVAFPIRRVG